MIVIVGSTKGGVGKTTLAFQVAVARQIAGHPVLLVDADLLGSAQNAATMRAEGDHRPPLNCVRLPDGRVLRTQLLSLASRHTDTVVDAGGRDTQAFRVSDVLVLPVQPRAVDVWALAGMAELIEEAQEAREIEGVPNSVSRSQSISLILATTATRWRPFRLFGNSPSWQHLSW